MIPLHFLSGKNDNKSKNNDSVKLNNQKAEESYMRENYRKCEGTYETMFIIRGTHHKYRSQCARVGIYTNSISNFSNNFCC